MNKKIYIGLSIGFGILLYAFFFLTRYSRWGFDYPFEIYWSDYHSQIIFQSILYIIIYSLLCVLAFVIYKYLKKKYPVCKQGDEEKTLFKQQAQEKTEETEVSNDEWLQGTGAVELKWLSRMMFVLGFIFLFGAMFVAMLGEWWYALSFLIAGGSCFIWVPIFQGIATVVKAAKLYIDEHSK